MEEFPAGQVTGKGMCYIQCPLCVRQRKTCERNQQKRMSGGKGGMGRGEGFEGGCGARLCAYFPFPPFTSPHLYSPPSLSPPLSFFLSPPLLSFPVEVGSTTKYAEKGSHCQVFFKKIFFS